METWKAINSLRVIREFDAPPIEDEHVERILNAGRRAGSSKNQQHWAFIVVRDPDRLRELAAVGKYAGHLAGATVAIALVTPSPASPSVMWDCGRAAQNMVLASWELGIGSAPATVYDHDLAHRLLGLPQIDGATSSCRSVTRLIRLSSQHRTGRVVASRSRKWSTWSSGRRTEDPLADAETPGGHRCPARRGGMRQSVGAKKWSSVQLATWVPILIDTSSAVLK